MASTYLTWTPSGAGSTTKWTTSFWVKRANLGGTQELVANWGSGNDNTTVRFLSGNNLEIVDYQSSSVVMKRVTNRLFRDTSAWYHIVVNIDTNQSTANDRTKLYINGVQETSFSTTTNYSSGQAHKWNTTYVHNIGQSGGSAGYFDGSMSHIHFIDGTAYDASAFGETDATTGEWEAKTSPSVTYGNNGFLILKDGNTITDQSSNSNNWTLGAGTLTNLKENPDNVFATLNPLINFQNSGSYSNGNNTATGGGLGTGDSPSSTLAVSSGKYYCEVKMVQTDGGQAVGIIDIDKWNPYANADEWFYRYSYGYGYQQNGQKFNNNSGSAYGDSYTNGDIIGIALDLDNNYIYFSKNGVWQNSGDPTSGASGTGSAFNVASGNYVFSFYHYYSHVLNTNFGNGYFGTTAVASAGTNASDNGIFEYDVPTGYTALSTKGLNL